ncbi:hypothetical protein HF086_011876 [Spodoptera exigua]|uniref:Uncharacterized protein n=1 Tax=Spodoptera exigua TaxID=7107 RepID=A0A922M9A6_SPOEX|nr:hypothetical protein HF086_011876 [Spodoptera exigua]
MPDLPASLQEHMREYAARDGSRPDPGYREPPPPATRAAPTAPPPPADPGKRDGLHAVAGPVRTSLVVSAL